MRSLELIHFLQLPPLHPVLMVILNWPIRPPQVIAMVGESRCATMGHSDLCVVRAGMIRMQQLSVETEAMVHHTTVSF